VNPLSAQKRDLKQSERSSRRELEVKKDATDAGAITAGISLSLPSLSILLPSLMGLSPFSKPNHQHQLSSTSATASPSPAPPPSGAPSPLLNSSMSSADHHLLR
ncbi:hypothetical protein U1Q18_042594, partial [Sarracenia purpurea var. burkii]